MNSSNPVIEVNNLIVEYGKSKNAVRAVDDISFKVMEGECVGFIGANGAGKSTTMKAMMGFLFPTSGETKLFGLPAGNAQSRARIGYLPEVALYYPFMKARELLELYGGLSGLNRTQLKERISPLLGKVGLGGKEETLLKNFSKGMQQRLGIAQSLIAEPECLILDELSSGLDPLGRHDLREVILELKQQGRTIFFSSHELTEIESLCDRVLMIHKGKIVTEAPVSELMKPLNEFEIVFKLKSGSEPLKEIHGLTVSRDGELFKLTVRDVGEYAKVLEKLTKEGHHIHQTNSHSRSLEEYFIELVQEKEVS